METLQLPRPLANQILAHAQGSPDAEICGLLGGQHNVAQNCYPIDNCAADPTRRYQMDPKKQIAAMRQMRETGEALVAIYHSHPSAPAVPSDIDIREADYLDAVYLVISLSTEGVLQMSAFTIANGAASPLPLELL